MAMAKKREEKNGMRLTIGAENDWKTWCEKYGQLSEEEKGKNKRYVGMLIGCLVLVPPLIIITTSHSIYIVETDIDHIKWYAAIDRDSFRIELCAASSIFMSATGFDSRQFQCTFFQFFNFCKHLTTFTHICACHQNHVLCALSFSLFPFVHQFWSQRKCSFNF